VRRLRAVTVLTDKPDATAAFVARFGYRRGAASGSVRRLLSATDAVDVRDATGYVRGLPGTGTADHVAFRAPDLAAVHAAEAELASLGASPTTLRDRTYFTSLYVREPGGTLLELATDGPGMTVDEAPDRLGQTLFVGPRDPRRAEDVRVVLPQFALPGEARRPARELPFVHRFYDPADPDGSTLVLLHGTGGNEADLMPLAHRIAPRATLLGVRGRSHEEGAPRWFRRLPAGGFDQGDIRAEAEAFAAFVEGAVAGYGLDVGRMTVVGYSNGANFAAAVTGLHPGAIRRAILLRASPVLERLPEPDLAGTRLLLLTGARDPYAPRAPDLERWLARCGAAVEARTIDAGHELTRADARAARAWLDAEGEADA
jgi:phospholipase/carboxylesterase